MNHNPSDDSENVRSSSQAVVTGTAAVKEHQESYHLNPSLQQALSCLDIKLEDELNRFRSKQEEQSPGVRSMPANEVIWEQQSVDFDTDADILTAEIIQPAISTTINADRDRCSQEESAPKSGGFIVIDGLSTSASSRNAITTIDRESLDLNFSSGGEIAPFHDEYLSSSQELLRQIQSGYPASSDDTVDNPAQTAPPARKHKHLTPIKIGSMAAACVLAGGAAYTYLNPNILASLTATKIVAPTATTNSLGQSIQSPNLAATEFTDLNLSTINTIKLPTAAPSTNFSTVPTATTINATGTATTPAAIPFNGTTAQITPPTTITSQPRLADSLVRSLLPPNFHSLAKQSGYRTIQPKVNR